MYYGRDPVVGRSIECIRGEVVEDALTNDAGDIIPLGKVLSGRKVAVTAKRGDEVVTLQQPADYEVYRRKMAKAKNKGKGCNFKPLPKGDTPKQAEVRAHYLRLQTPEVWVEPAPIERKPKFVFDRKHAPAFPHGARPKGWVAKGCYTNPNQNR